MKFIDYLKEIINVLEDFPDFEWELLDEKSDYPVIKIRSKSVRKNVDLVIASGVHGEEIAGPATIVQNLAEILQTARKDKIKLLIYPLVNAYGFEKKKRFNADGISCNSFWIHEKGVLARESKAVKKDVSRYRSKYFLSMHEEGETEKKGFYLYAFGNIEAAEQLVKMVSGENDVFADGFDGIYGEDQIRNGIIYDLHDGTFEDFMSHQGCRASICTETHLKLPMEKRVAISLSLIKEMIKISAKK
jgi:predicted deacylase